VRCQAAVSTTWQVFHKERVGWAPAPAAISGNIRYRRSLKPLVSRFPPVAGPHGVAAAAALLSWARQYGDSANRSRGNAKTIAIFSLQVSPALSAGFPRVERDAHARGVYCRCCGERAHGRFIVRERDALVRT
jgi:hypothetical protein